MKLKTGNVISAIIMILIGAFLVFYPGDTINTVVTVFGYALIIAGAVAVISAILQKENRSIPNLVQGAVEIIVGIWVVSNPGTVVSIFPMIAGAIIVVSGVASFFDAVGRRSGTSSGWKVSLILSVVTIILGVIIFANPFSTVTLLLRIIGVAFLYNGLVSLFGILRK